MYKISFFIASLLLVAGVSFAQPGKGKKVAGQKMDDAFAELKSALSLTSEQEPKVKTAIENRNKQFKAIREEIKAKYPNKDERQKNRAKINEEFKDKRKAVNKSFKAEMNSVLNAEQQNLWKEFKTKKREANKAKRDAMQKAKKPLTDDAADEAEEEDADED